MSARASKQQKREAKSSAADPPSRAGKGASAASAGALPMPSAPARSLSMEEAPVGGRIVVMDNGGNTVKVGFAGQPVPKSVPSFRASPVLAL
jgi:hypothetical protein